MNETVGEDHPLDPSAVGPGTSVLIAGPPMTGKRQLMLDVVAEDSARAGIVITTKRSAAQLKSEFATWTDLAGWDLRIIDCVTSQQAVGPLRERDDVRYISSAGDLTGIGIKVFGDMRDFYHDPERETATVGLSSLSTMLMYADLRRVYQFIHVLTGRIESSEFRGVFTLDAAPDSDRSASMLAQLFETMVEVRSGEAGPEVRVRGETPSLGPRTWTPV